MQAMWESMRGGVVEKFPKAPGLPRNRKVYLRLVDDMYKNDAYHSLSIEGYNVNPALIERVQQGDWDPDHHSDDRQNRDALAARGYWQAFQKVKETVAEVIAGGDAGSLARTAHKEWYRELFQPFVAAGLIEAGALAGYRNSRSICALRGMCRRDGKWSAMRCRRSSICWSMNPIPASAPCSGIGCSAISIPIRTATGGWRDFS